MSDVARDPDPEALFRYALVAELRALMARGRSRAAVVRELAAADHPTFDGRIRRVSPRTLYRWLAAFEQGGFARLVPADRVRTDSSVVLSAELLAFLRQQKKVDPAASIPELIARARERGVVAPDERVDRTTAYRAARRMGLAVAHRRVHPPGGDTHRWAYPHRMQMALADGKHFRAGIHRARRLALVFLDDASRFGLGVRVGTTEDTRLFLLGLYAVIRKHGLMGALYLDGGPGFISLDTREVMRRLERALIHGTARYPEGHGKIERFNRRITPWLRALDGRPDVDPDLDALTLRLTHYLEQVYNHTPHEGLGGLTPAERFHADTAPLAFPPSDDELARCFVTFLSRRVTADHCVPIESVDYEVPRGHAGERIQIHHQLLTDTYAVVHEGRLVTIHPVDLARNARTRRARGQASDEPSARPPEPTAADLSFARVHGPIVGPDGGFTDPHPIHEEDP